MTAEMGEYAVGAYLKFEEGCDFVDYHVRPPGGGLEGLKELDVVGLNFKTQTAYLCEVTTHIGGLLYKSSRLKTVEVVRTKHERQRQYAKRYLANFSTHVFMFWSPVVPRGYLTENLPKISRDLKLVINEMYRDKINRLQERARKENQDTGNPFFRTLQILEHLRS